MTQQSLFSTDHLVQQQKPEPKTKYKSTKAAKQRYNLVFRLKKAGVKINSKTRTFCVSSIKQIDPITRRRLHKLMNHGFAGNITIPIQ